MVKRIVMDLDDTLLRNDKSISAYTGKGSQCGENTADDVTDDNDHDRVEKYLETHCLAVCKNEERLETHDLTIKKADFEDWKDLYRNIWSREESARYMLWKLTADEEAAKQRMQRTLEWQKVHRAYTVYEKESGQAIGWGGMEEISPGVYEDTGLAIGPDFVKRGYGKQILKAVTEFCFKNLQAVKFIGSCRSENLASKKLMLSCGFSYHHSESRIDPGNGQKYELEFYELQKERKMNIVVISFSGRANGNCHNIADKICGEFRNEKVTLYDFSAFRINPCGECMMECFKNRENCPFFGDKAFELYEAVGNSDLTFFVVPNYCDFPCSNYFAFNERGQCYFQGREELMKSYLRIKKRFIVVSNTEKANFIRVFQDHVTEGEQPDILFLSARKYNRMSIKGDLMEEEKAVADLAAFVRG